MPNRSITTGVSLLWTILIATSCLLPASTFKPFSFDTLISLDKVIHLLLYWIFFTLWALAWPAHSKSILLRLLVISILYGVVVELLQASMSFGRSYELDDIIANAIGSLLGLVCLPLVQKNMPLIKKYLPFLNKVY